MLRVHLQLLSAHEWFTKSLVAAQVRQQVGAALLNSLHVKLLMVAWSYGTITGR